jgi:hypothetical protein
MLCDRNEKDDDWECQRRSLAADEGAQEKAKTTPLRNEASLNCVSLRSQLDCEVTCGAVQGQDERRPSAAPLTAPQVTPELYAARKKTSKVSRQDRQNGAYCRFCGNVAIATKNKNKEGRHVGLDFYDLLIEVLYRMRPREVGR